MQRTNEIKAIMRKLKESEIVNESATCGTNEEAETSTENDATEADLVLAKLEDILARFEKILAITDDEESEEEPEEAEDEVEEEPEEDEEDEVEEEPEEEAEDEEAAEESYTRSLERRLANLEKRFTESRRRTMRRGFCR